MTALRRIERGQCGQTCRAAGSSPLQSVSSCSILSHLSTSSINKPRDDTERALRKNAALDFNRRSVRYWRIDRIFFLL